MKINNNPIEQYGGQETLVLNSNNRIHYLRIFMQKIYKIFHKHKPSVEQYYDIWNPSNSSPHLIFVCKDWFCKTCHKHFIKITITVNDQKNPRIKQRRLKTFTIEI